MRYLGYHWRRVKVIELSCNDYVQGMNRLLYKEKKRTGREGKSKNIYRM